MALQMDELVRQNAALTALNGGQLGAHRNRPLPQHARIPMAGSSWKPPGASIAPPAASAPPAAAAKATAKQLDLNKKLGKPKK